MESRLLNTPDFYIFDEKKPARMQNTYRNKMIIGGIDKQGKVGIVVQPFCFEQVMISWNWMYIQGTSGASMDVPNVRL